MSIDLAGYQQTIARPVTLPGVGVHSGTSSSVTFLPGDPDTGIVFRRQLGDGRMIEIPAISANVISTALCTVIGFDQKSMVATVEHIMAAFFGAGIDNVIVDVDGLEIPIMDGSAADFAAAITDAGTICQDVKRRYIRVTRPVRIDLNGSYAEFVPHDGTRLEIDIDFDSPAIGRQAWSGEITPKTFREELSRARTFGFMRDVERLWASGHALGSSLENSIVIADNDTVINVEGLRYPDEFVRHKVVDAVGDLSLAGVRFIGCYRSYRGGHKLNAMALAALLADSTAYDMVETPTMRHAAHRADYVSVSGAVFAPWTR